MVDLVRAFRGGPGRFYAYTFAAGMVALTGAPWWAQLAEYLAKLTIQNLSGGSSGSSVGDVNQVSPLFIAVCGIAICLLSMYGFHKANTSSSQEVDEKEGHFGVVIPEGAHLGDALELISEISNVPLNFTAVDLSLLEAPIQAGQFEWKSLKDSLESLPLLIKSTSKAKLLVHDVQGGLLLTWEEKESV